VPNQNRAGSLKLWVVLSRAHAAVAAHVRADIARHGLSTAEFGALEALYHKGPMLVGEVKRKILVSSGGITYVIDRLEEKGLVERRECPQDRRASYAALTEAGEALIARIFPEHADCVGRALSGLTEEERDAATALLRTLGREAARLERCGPDD
jgi:MarR family transcriptional regulator, 2-MHQ and catechol-resistance regulon repressor